MMRGSHPDRPAREWRLTALLTAPAMLLAALLSATAAQARYDERDARRDCEDAIFADKRFDKLYQLRIGAEANYSFTIDGRASMRDEPDPDFACHVRHKEAVGWHIRENRRQRQRELSGGGVLGAALSDVIAVVQAEHDAHHDSRVRYARGYGYAFDDQRYLEEECRRDVKRNLEFMLGAAAKVTLGHYRLEGRVLHGDGALRLALDGRRRLTFSCLFDRRGRVVDGAYRYY